MLEIFMFYHVIIITLFADLHNREQSLMKIVLVINLEVKDNHEEAAVGAKLTLELCQAVK